MAEDNRELLQWYVLQTHSGFENRAKLGLIEAARQAGLSDRLGEILIPEEQVVETRKGEKTQRARKFFPGYMFAQLQMSNSLWHVVKNTPRIIGFMGGSPTEPSPIPEREVRKIMGQMEEGAKAPKAVLSFQVGDQVRVVDGPFKNFSGMVEEVNNDKSKVRVLVSIFGRATPVELDFIQVESTG